MKWFAHRLDQQLLTWLEVLPDLAELAAVDLLG